VKNIKRKKFTWWGFSSTTNEVEVLSSELFFGKHGKRTLFNLHTKLGCDINKYSVYQKESENFITTRYKIRSY